MTTAGTAEAEGERLGGRIRAGFAWCALSNASLRVASLLTGVVLARILAPEDFGVFAVALMVQAVVINLAELGLAADLVRHGNLEHRGPTITTVALVASGALAALMWWAAGPLASVMGAPDAVWPIRIMALTLPMAGLSVVPYAQLQREFRQSHLFGIDAANTAVATVLTISLAVLGWGALALAIGRVAGQSLATVLQFAVTRRRLRVGWDPEIARSGIRFGLPLALAGVLAWTLLNVDTAVIGSIAGVTALGFYVLAFNISSWPTSVIGNAVRAVAFPAFAQHNEARGGRDGSVAVPATALVWAAALPVAAALAVLAEPTVRLLYGERWLAAAPVLVALAVFGGLRVVFDLWVAWFTACGASRTLLLTQGVWLVCLVPVMWWTVREYGIVGAAWAHAMVAVALMLPVHLVLLRRLSVPIGSVLRQFVPPLLAVLPAAAVGAWVSSAFGSAFVQLALGSSALMATYALLILRWVRPALASLRDSSLGDSAQPETPARAMALA